MSGICGKCAKIEEISWKKPLKGKAGAQEMRETLERNPSLVKLAGYSNMNGEFHSYYFCPDCRSVFEQYSYCGHGAEDGEHSLCNALLKAEEESYYADYLRLAASYLRKKEIEAEIALLAGEEGEIEVYSSAPAKQLARLNGKGKLPFKNTRDEAFFSFEEMIGSYWTVRWFANQNYYIKTSVPKKSLLVRFEGGNDYNSGFFISSSASVSLEKTEVFCPFKKAFVRLSEWEVPPAFDQLSPEVDGFLEVYGELKDAFKPFMQEKAKQNGERVEKILASAYPHIDFENS